MSNERPPDLQEWIARYGGYLLIPWGDWDRAVAEYHERRRDELAAELRESRRGAP
jgi:hypothetical protein